ncbi:MAG: SDR family NAD(P)-dependent oxidoreductase [Promethearchaeota archaeon]
MDPKLEDKHVLITGASGGIGTVTTRLFLQENARVSAQYHHQVESLMTLKSSYPKTLNVIQGDIRKESDVKNLFDKSTEYFGRVAVLIANAGIWPSEEVPIHEMTLAQWHNTLAVNLTGVFLCTKYFFQNLKSYPAKYASLILVGSTAGVFGEAGHADYATSKAALSGLMKTLKNEIVHLAEHGRVNLVNPGWTLTPMANETLKDKVTVKRVLQTIPLRKIALPIDIGQVILYLASDNLSGHVSGQEITIAGGMEGRVLFSPEDIDQGDSENSKQGL